LQVVYEATSADAWHDSTLQLWGAGANPDALEHLRALWGIVRLRSAEPALLAQMHAAVPTLERMLGHPPQVLGAWLGPFLKAYMAAA
jgi:hypothetical protein